MHKYKVTFKLLSGKTNTVMINAVTHAEVKNIMYTAYGDDT